MCRHISCSRTNAILVGFSHGEVESLDCHGNVVGRVSSVPYEFELVGVVDPLKLGAYARAGLAYLSSRILYLLHGDVESRVVPYE